jgi:hypothetical protein
MVTATDGQVDVKGQEEEVKKTVTNDDGVGNEEGTEEEAERIDMTKEEYDAALQKEADRRVAQAIKKREAEHQKELEKETAKARKEAEELAKLSESERMKVEKEREEMTLAKQREELNKERGEFEKERLRLQAEKELAIRKLPVNFSQYVLGDDAEDTFDRIAVLEEEWQKAIETEVNDRLKSKTPKLGTSNKKAYFTQSQVAEMSQAEVNANLAEIEESMKSW